MPPTWRKVLEDLKKLLEDAKSIVDNNTLPFDQQTKDDLAEKLDGSEDICDRILDPGILPTLNPSTAGSVDTSVATTPLATCAQKSYDLADEALIEYDGNNDQDYIGTRIRTIRDHMLTPYRSQAGLNPA